MNHLDSLPSREGGSVGAGGVTLPQPSRAVCLFTPQSPAPTAPLNGSLCGGAAAPPPCLSLWESWQSVRTD